MAMTFEGQVTNNKMEDYCDMDVDRQSEVENIFLFTTLVTPEITAEGLERDKEELEQEEEEEEEEEDEMMQSLRKREKNIQENKAMLAKLLSELTPPFKAPPKIKQMRRDNVPSWNATEIIRRNPPRKCRRGNFGMEEESISPELGEEAGDPMTDAKMEEYVEKKGKSYDVAKQPIAIRSVDEITREDLDNVAYHRRDKIWARDGSYCHQCRQKTLDTKTSCRSGTCTGLRGQVCGPCLRRRYGEDARAALLDPAWACPTCRGICNCSQCRRKEGHSPTGVLWDLAGHINAHAYLQRSSCH